MGVTGTRNGMTDLQKTNVAKWLLELVQEPSKYDGYFFRHGDCVGVDFKTAEYASTFGYLVICHPPIKEDLRAHHRSDWILKPKSYFERNRDIVNMSDILLVVPFQNEWQNKGGTWYTYDYAMKHGKKVIVFYPDGRIIENNSGQVVKN